jgi:hypothetical protein
VSPAEICLRERRSFRYPSVRRSFSLAAIWSSQAGTRVELEVGCDSSLHVAVHAVVVSFGGDGHEVFEETAWGCTPTRGSSQTHNAEVPALQQ